MAKQGMKRIDRTHTEKRNEFSPVPELSGKAKHTKEKANPIIEGTSSPSLEVFHNITNTKEKPIPSDVYPVIDTDLARDNVENDLPDSELQDL